MPKLSIDRTTQTSVAPPPSTAPLFTPATSQPAAGSGKTAQSGRGHELRSHRPNMYGTVKNLDQVFKKLNPMLHTDALMPMTQNGVSGVGNQHWFAYNTDGELVIHYTQGGLDKIAQRQAEEDARSKQKHHPHVPHRRSHRQH